MNSIRILWLYDDLLDLYGDFGNIAIIAERLGRMGFDCGITRLSIADDPDLTQYHMVYIGPGKAKNLARAAEHLIHYAELIRQAVEAGVLFLVTGNARLLFGQSFTDGDGKEHPGVGLFGYTGVETGAVFISDVLGRPVFAPDTLCYGFINRTAHIKGNDGAYLFDLRQGAGDDDQPAQHEGNLYHNFFGTWQLGPVLVKNPRLLCELLRRLTGDAYVEPDNTLEQTALDATLAEFD